MLIFVPDPKLNCLTLGLKITRRRLNLLLDHERTVTSGNDKSSTIIMNKKTTRYSDFKCSFGVILNIVR